MSKKKRLLRKKTDEGRAVPMSPEVQRAMEGQFQRFREKFGRDPGPDDPVFFDPDADTPQELDWDRVDSDIVGAMVKAGIEPEKVYAYRKTGLIVTEENWGLLAKEQQEEWEAAIADYQERLSGEVQ